MVAELREVDPRFDRAFAAFVARWKDDADTARESLPYYDYYAEIAHIIANDIRIGNRGPLAPIMELVEKLLVEGDEETREAAAVGLLEGIQSHMLLTNTGLHIANAYLGPETTRWWKKLINFWDCEQWDALGDD